MSDALLDDGDEKPAERLDEKSTAQPKALPPIALTEAQEKQILTLWNADPATPPTIKELTQALFGKDLDGRSNEAKLVKQALSKHSLRAKTTADPVREIELSEAHKAFIINNARNMNTLELAKAIFNNPFLTPLHGECRAVQKFRASLMPTTVFTPNALSDAPTEAYQPPKIISEALEKVNGYINFAFDKDKLTAQQRKNLDKLIGYLHTYRFIAQMNNYMAKNDRILAEDAFIRATYDKPDLEQQDIDQYIEYANQVVNGFKVQRRSEQLSQQLENITTSNDETLKISMSLVEAIGKASTEYHQCLARQQKLLDDLREKRSARMSKQIKDNASILNLIHAWKNEETRLEMLAHAEKEQEKVSAEVDRLSSLSELKAKIFGLTKDEIRYG